MIMHQFSPLRLSPDFSLDTIRHRRECHELVETCYLLLARAKYPREEAVAVEATLYRIFKLLGDLTHTPTHEVLVAQSRRQLKAIRFYLWCRAETKPLRKLYLPPDEDNDWLASAPTEPDLPAVIMKPRMALPDQKITAPKRKGYWK